MNQVATKQDKGSVMEQVLIKDDLRNLTEEQRSNYYMKVCESVGLNPLTQPFAYIVLNSKMTLYALRGATDQLRAVHKVSVEELTETEREGVFIVTAKVRNGEGRTDIAKGAVNISGLKGENLANALMKAETKAKRRATLSICGLGMLDETEVETIPGAVTVGITPSEVDHSKPKSPFKNADLRRQYHNNVVDNFHKAKTCKELSELVDMDKTKLKEMEDSGSEADHLSLGEIRKQYQIAWNRLALATNDEETTFDQEEVPAYVKSEMEAEEERLKGLDF